MGTLPDSPEELRSCLIDVFPSFAAVAEEAQSATDLGDLTLHQVMIDFGPFFSKNQNAFSKSQIARFGKFLRLVLGSHGTLENAVATCFVEYAHQLGVEKTLRPWLGKRGS